MGGASKEVEERIITFAGHFDPFLRAPTEYAFGLLINLRLAHQLR
jgi:hypothetical protein